MKPKISICIPAYNAEAFLSTAIESCLAQIEPPHEIVVSDDHSTDRTADIVARYAASSEMVRLVRPPCHAGMGLNYHFAIGSATGTHAAILNADDAYHPSFVRLMSDELQKAPEVGLVAAGGFHCDSRMKPFSVFGFGYPRKLLLPPEGFLRMLKGCSYTVSAAVWLKKALELVPPLDQDASLATDWYWALCVGAKYAVKFVAKPLSYYRYHDANWSHSNPSRWRSHAGHMLSTVAAREDLTAALCAQLQLQVQSLAGFGASEMKPGRWQCGISAGKTHAKRILARFYRAHPAYLM